jgi:hypothetical protein
MQEYPDSYIRIYTYLFYMTCPNPDLNPYFHMKDNEREEMILHDIDADFSTEDDPIIFALGKCKKMYETEASRAYNGIKNMLDNLADYMAITKISDGKDGNITQLVNSAAKFEQIRQSFKGALKDLMDEQKSTVRGGKDLSYDT